MANFALKLCSASLLCIALLSQEQGWAADEIKDGRSSVPETGGQDAFNAGRLQGKLESAFTFNEELERFDIAVNIDDKTAVLTGAVATEAHKDLASDIARQIDGIKMVDNQLNITPELAGSPASPTEAALPQERDFAQFARDLSTTAAIKARLVAHEHVNGMSIKVETYQGRVTLSGETESQVQKDLAEFVAKKNSDIAHLDNRIIITGP